MEKIDFQTQDIFEKKYLEFSSSRDAVRLQQKFEVKPYIEKYKTAHYFCIGLSYFIHILTVATSVLCAIGLLSLKIPYAAACVLGTIVVVGIEIAKRLTFSPAVKEYLQFRKKAFAQITISTILLVLSCALVWFGTDATVTHFTEKPTLLSVDSASNFETKRVENLEKELTNVQNTQNWKGKLTNKGQDNYNKLLVQMESLTAQKSEKEKDAKAQNEHILKQNELKKQDTTTQVKYITIILDLFLFLILYWLEYYDYRSTAEFAANQTNHNNNDNNNNTELDNNNDNNIDSNDNDSNVNDKDSNVNDTKINANGSKKRKRIGFNNENRNNENRNNENRNNENRKETLKNNENRNELSNVRKCEHCNNEYILKHHKQKYCSDLCRVEHWELKNGKKINKIKK